MTPFLRPAHTFSHWACSLSTCLSLPFPTHLHNSGALCLCFFLSHQKIQRGINVPTLERNHSGAQSVAETSHNQVIPRHMRGPTQEKNHSGAQSASKLSSYVSTVPYTFYRRALAIASE